MTEAELSEQLMYVIELVLISISLSFTFISAYLVGLYWFLKNHGVALKTFAFGILTLCLFSMAFLGFGIYRHFEGINLALLELKDRDELSALGRMATEQIALGMGINISAGLTFIFALIYCCLFYITFFYTWGEKQVN